MKYLIYLICQNLKKSPCWYGAQETSTENAFVARKVNLLVANDDGAVGENAVVVFECRVDLTISKAVSQIGAEINPLNGGHRSKVQHGV